MHLVISPRGDVRSIYSETLDLRVFGLPIVTRASHVEPNGLGGWIVDLTPTHGPILGPFDLRSSALVAEQDWLEQNWLTRPLS
jgi:hypothetical protein